MWGKTSSAHGIQRRVFWFLRAMGFDKKSLLSYDQSAVAMVPLSLAEISHSAASVQAFPYCLHGHLLIDDGPGRLLDIGLGN